MTKVVLDEGMEVKVCTIDGKVITGFVEAVSRKTDSTIVLTLGDKEDGRKSN